MHFSPTLWLARNCPASSKQEKERLCVSYWTNRFQSSLMNKDQWFHCQLQFIPTLWCDGWKTPHGALPTFSNKQYLNEESSKKIYHKAERSLCVNHESVSSLNVPHHQLLFQHWRACFFFRCKLRLPLHPDTKEPYTCEKCGVVNLFPWKENYKDGPFLKTKRTR